MISEGVALVDLSRGSWGRGGEPEDKATMNELLGNVKGFFKSDCTVIDNYVSRMHYKVTVCVLIGLSILVAGIQFIADPVACSSEHEVVSPHFLSKFCRVQATFSLPDPRRNKIGAQVGRDTQGEKKIYHAYYQWVCFVLLLQAALFYVPRLFWKAVEGGLVRNLVLQLRNPVLPEETKRSSRKLLVKYLSTNLHHHNLFLCGYLTTEVGHFVNVIAQMLLMDKFLGGEFSIYGSEVLQVTEWEWSSRSDPMTEVFPRLTQCTFYTFGPVGDPRKHDATCALPINILNERIYVFLWFWFVVLACLSGAVLTYRLLILIPRVRYFVLRLCARRTNKESVERVCSSCNLGDWLVLYLLCKNMHPVNFRDVIDDYLQSLDYKRTDKE